MKRVVVIGGAGAMGQIIVRDLLDTKDLEVVVADYDQDKADAFARSLNNSRVRGDRRKGASAAVTKTGGK